MEEALIHSDHVQERRSEDKIKPLTAFQIRVMLVLCFVNFCSCTGFTLLTTFFPSETMIIRDMTATQNSLIFAVYALINIFACPIFGYFLPSIGALTMLLSGLALSGVGALLFSFLHLELDPVRFTIVACLVRVIQAFACSMYLTAAYSIMTHVWSERRTQAVGLLEMTTGCGMIAGPVVGAALYNMSGFALPFQVLGVFLLLGMIPTAWILRNFDMNTSSGKHNSITNSIMLSSRLYSGDFTEQLTFKQFMSIFTNPATYATILMTILCWSAMDFVLPGLQLHVQLMYPELGHGTSKITTKTSVLMAIFAVAYGIGTPVVGKLCTIWGHKSSRPCMLIGGLLIAISYLFLGPQKNLAVWTGLSKVGIHEYLGGLVHVSIIFVLLGTGLALVAVPSVEDLVQCCYKVGLPKQGIATVAVVSGFYNCILFIGEFVGPMLQGLITDQLSLNNSLSNMDVVTETYFWWAIICAVTTVVSGGIYGIEYLWDDYKAGLKPTRQPLSDGSLLIKDDNAQCDNSTVFGPQSFSLSMSTRRNRRRNPSISRINSLAEYG